MIIIKFGECEPLPRPLESFNKIFTPELVQIICKIKSLLGQTMTQLLNFDVNLYSCFFIILLEKNCSITALTEVGGSNPRPYVRKFVVVYRWSAV